MEADRHQLQTTPSFSRALADKAIQAIQESEARKSLSAEQKRRQDLEFQLYLESLKRKILSSAQVFHSLIQESRNYLSHGEVCFYEDKYEKFVHYCRVGIFMDELVLDIEIQSDSLRQRIAAVKKRTEDELKLKEARQKMANNYLGYRTYCLVIESETNLVDDMLYDGVYKNPALLTALSEFATRIDPTIRTIEQLRQFLIYVRCLPIKQKFRRIFIEHGIPFSESTFA